MKRIKRILREDGWAYSLMILFCIGFAIFLRIKYIEAQQMDIRDPYVLTQLDKDMIQLLSELEEDSKIMIIGQGSKRDMVYTTYGIINYNFTTPKGGHPGAALSWEAIENVNKFYDYLGIEHAYNYSS